MFYIFPVLLIPEFIGIVKTFENGFVGVTYGYDAHLGGMFFGLVFLVLWKILSKDSKISKKSKQVKKLKNHHK